MNVYWRKAVFTVLAAVSLILGIAISLELYIYFRNAEAALDGGIVAEQLEIMASGLIYQVMAISLLFAGAFAYGAARSAAIIQRRRGKLMGHK